MSKPDLVLLRDSREQCTPAWSTDVARCETVTLPFGDFSVRGASDVLALELKWSLDDYVTCCTFERERFETMLGGLSTYPVRAIIVAGSEQDVREHKYVSQTNPKSVLGSSLSWLADFHVATLWAGDRGGATRLIEWFARRTLRKLGNPAGAHAIDPRVVWPEFSELVHDRLQAGARAYACQSRTLPETLDEIAEELADVCGWSVVAFARIQSLRARAAELEALSKPHEKGAAELAAKAQRLIPSERSKPY